MKKIRINELARELEVKPGVIIEMLPVLGVQEKKTHSSSVDEDVALELRQRLVGGEAPTEGGSNGEGFSHNHSPEVRSGESPASSSENEVERQTVAVAASAEQPRPAVSLRSSPSAPVEARPPRLPLQPSPGREHLRETGAGERPHPAPSIPVPPATVAHAAPGIPSQAPPASSTSAETERPAPTFRPLRAPLGTGSGAIHPPLAQGQTHAATPGPVNRNVSIPARPLPPATPRVGPSTPLAPAGGPRQPLPPESSKSPSAAQATGAHPPAAQMLGERPARPAPASPGLAPAALVPDQPSRPASPQMRPPSPAAPRTQPPTHVVAPGAPASAAPPSAVPGAPIPARPTPPRSAGPGLTPGAPIAPRPPMGRPLAGQPQARPVVPPRQDILQRLNKQARPGPAVAPAAPRPGAPARPSPAPGQPLYRGPVRPGQPLMRGPGAPGGPTQPGVVRRPGGLRPMHPTTLRPESPVPAEQQRRHQAKPGGRQVPRKREEVEGILRERVSKRQVIAEPPPIDREITVAEGITVKELSEKLGVKANLVIKKTGRKEDLRHYQPDTRCQTGRRTRP